jgi:bifunctional non-homologous end joining protein LigD
MLASLADASLTDAQYLYEPKYDGIRAVVDVVPGGSVHIWSRAGHDKTAQFPEIARALAHWSRGLEAPVVLDGEIVALAASGAPTGFGRLQSRIHRSSVDTHFPGAPVAFIAFDLLRDGRTDLRDRPLLERRAALERIFPAAGPAPTKTRKAGTNKARADDPPVLRISEVAHGDGRALYARALDEQWEGLVAKRITSRYQSGTRTPDWRKLKILHEQEFVIGGWTRPRHTRAHFGALLLGVYDPPAGGARRGPRASGRAHASSGRHLRYVGHTGTGFTGRELARLMALLTPLETAACPFGDPPATNEEPHWVRPTLVAQIKFAEWTADGRLRHPVYLGLRDDKQPEDVVRESNVPLAAVTKKRTAGRGARQPATGPLLDQLRAIEESRGDGVLDLPGGERLSVGNLHKVFWPAQKRTKGDLFRYYVTVAPFILPVVADRPLVMKRFPNGIAGTPFYQHRAPEAPPGVRVDTPDVPDGIPQVIGGSLLALLYTTQLAAISQDPWLSRLQSVPFADHVALDLDPADGVPFARVLDVARWIRDELQALDVTAVPKTSGADGLHIYIPLPPKMTYEAGQLFCQIVATVVAQKHPKVATVERQVRARGARVYVDYLQNILGKTLASAYSARASDRAGVSTPLTWQEIEDGVRREDFTIDTVPARLAAVGDLWAAVRESKGADLSRVLRYSEGTRTTRAKSKK